LDPRRQFSAPQPISDGEGDDDNAGSSSNMTGDDPRNVPNPGIWSLDPKPSNPLTLKT